MPTYVYRREDGSTFETMQSITEEPLTVCPTTGQAVKRVIGGGAGLIFKGSGFYLTDYARKDSGKSDASTTSSPSPAETSSNGESGKKAETSTVASKSDPD